MIKVYNLNEITPELFLQNHIKENRPCVIKKFFHNDKCLDFYKKNINRAIEYKIGNLVSNFMNELCVSDFIKKIESNFTITQCTRAWQHNKNNVTRWHYDGNGQNVINICLAGKKRFFLAPPSSIPVYPLSNIALPYDWDSEWIDIETYDLLYIPSYWFHKVETLEDKTITINYLFYDDINNNLFASHRDIYLYTLHDYFNTAMCKDIICLITKKKPMTYCLMYGVYEMIWIYMLLLIFFILLYRNNVQLYKITNIILFIIVSYFYFNKEYDNATVGINILYAFYLYIFLILINLTIKFILPKCKS